MSGDIETYTFEYTDGHYEYGVMIEHQDDDICVHVEAPHRWNEDETFHDSEMAEGATDIGRVVHELADRVGGWIES